MQVSQQFHNIYTNSNQFKLFRGDIIKRRYWCAVKSLQMISLGQKYYYRTSGTKKQIQHTARQKQGPKWNDLLWPEGRPVGSCAWFSLQKISADQQRTWEPKLCCCSRNTQNNRWNMFYIPWRITKGTHGLVLKWNFAIHTINTANLEWNAFNLQKCLQLD